MNITIIITQFHAPDTFRPFLQERLRSMSPVPLVIVDAHDLSRNGLQLLVRQGDVPVDLIGAFTDLQSCESDLREGFNGVMLLDDRVSPQVSIHRLLQSLYTRYPQIHILVMSQNLNLVHIQMIMNSGAAGFIYKDERLNTVLSEAIRQAQLGKPYFSPQAWAIYYYGQVHHLLEKLNPNDLNVLHLLEKGYTVQEIAAQLKVNARTVYRTRERLRETLEVRTNEQIVDAARQRGLLQR